MTSFLAIILALPFMLVVLIPVALYYAWAASYLWGWFIVPTFGLSPLSTLQLWGITLFLSMLRPKMTFDDKKKEIDWGSAVAAVLIVPLLVLSLGYAIRFWWM